MVDSVGGIGSVSNIGQINQGQQDRGKTDQRDAAERAEPRDRVEISQEARDLAEVERATQETRDALAQDNELSLGLDPEFTDSQE